MAFKTEMVENKIAVNYHGVVVYHTHKDNNIDNSVNDYIFSLDPYGNEYSVDEGDGEVFDIRNLAGYDDACTPEANLLRAIDSGLLGETNIHEREGGATETHSVEDGLMNIHAQFAGHICRRRMKKSGKMVPFPTLVMAIFIGFTVLNAMQTSPRCITWIFAGL